MTNPYSDLPPRAFWRSAVAEAGAFGLEGLWQPKFPIRPAHRIVTAGSCFAQHIGRALAADGYGWLDAEPAPPFLNEEAARRFNYGVFSCRTGNIYTPAMLDQWLDIALDDAEAHPECWLQDGRVFDPLRPAIEPGGFGDPAEFRAARARTGAALKRAVSAADIFVFTLGLTEAWVNAESGLEYAMCPGTHAGTYDPEVHVFRNRRMADIAETLERAIRRMRGLNPDLRVLLTVSPVPLTATASGRHVLTATSHSKSILRAVAGQVAEDDVGVDYFPSYEIITHPVFRGVFYQPNMRSVAPEGVATVMRHFFGDQARAFPRKGRRNRVALAGKPLKSMDVVCEEEMLSAFGPAR
ncbi:GSCFA domain-containing protein [Aestuariicoccus sp. MJ-SS9]|uniref:GSCFA domain-containing protein n=1 Tax=Aestuariicoccus sp. MJ-SS9 TaxID=3079855 RepID=UPI002910C20B|nr:GSCFA domain-containing protein [Aestuariicoccus sp. MJ-SS9]MDU8914158.1 GSCFA domain-containing protein [Aestuariicoccus sp. MJ-SS9]